jgi:hypothetical protein
VSSSRLTAAAVIELINAARSEILLVSYATHTEPSIAGALSAAVTRGVAITLLAERHEDNPSYTALGIPFPGLRALRLHWPAGSRPPGTSLHAKIIVVDDQVALVGSANLTSRPWSPTSNAASSSAAAHSLAPSVTTSLACIQPGCCVECDASAHCGRPVSLAPATPTFNGSTLDGRRRHIGDLDVPAVDIAAFLSLG